MNYIYADYVNKVFCLVTKLLNWTYIVEEKLNCQILLTNVMFITLTLQGRTPFRSSGSQMFFKIVVVKNFTKFTGKHLSWNLFKIKFQACNFIRKIFQDRCFPVRFAKFLRTPFFTEHLQWLLLSFMQNIL